MMDEQQPVPSVADFLDRLKALYVSDYMTAKMLDVGQPTVSNWRSGQHLPDVSTCVRIAEQLNVDPAHVIAAVQAQRARQQRGQHRNGREALKLDLEITQWVRIAQRFAAGLVLAIGGATLGGFNNNAFAAPFPAGAEGDGNTHCARTKRRRVLGVTL